MEANEATSIIFEEAGPTANIIFGAVIDPNLKDDIRVTVIATGFNMPKVISETNTIENSETVGFDPPRTNHLQEIENKPLHAQKEDPNKIREKKGAEKVLTFDDTSESSVIYGKDLQIPAFIRRQHDLSLIHI